MRTLSIGMIVCATSSEATIAITIGIATCFMRIVISLGEPNTSGTNTMIVASVPASVATPTSLTPRSVARARIAGIELPVAEHAFGDHHGVVDQHADRQHHAHHREDVERQAEEVHRGERDQQRAGHRERNDRRHRPVAQEEEQHDDREHRPIRPALRRSPSELRMLSAWLPMTMMLMPCSCGSVFARSISLSTRRPTRRRSPASS